VELIFVMRSASGGVGEQKREAIFLFRSILYERIKMKHRKVKFQTILLHTIRHL